jgi:hypothetical protein
MCLFMIMDYGRLRPSCPHPSPTNLAYNIYTCHVTGLS